MPRRDGAGAPRPALTSTRRIFKDRDGQRGIMVSLVQPSVTLESVKIQGAHLTSIDLEVRLRVENPNPIDAILRELPFTVWFRWGNRREEIASGNTGRMEIAANGSTPITVPVTSYDLPLFEALATIIARGDLRLEIEGNAVIDHTLGWTLPFTETVDVTERMVIDALEGRAGKKEP